MGVGSRVVRAGIAVTSGKEWAKVIFIPALKKVRNF